MHSEEYVQTAGSLGLGMESKDDKEESCSSESEQKGQRRRAERLVKNVDRVLLY
jgi:hypothetical protein